MNGLKYLLNFHINSSIHVALAVYALTWITLLELGLKYDENVLYFVFYASIAGYNFVKYFSITQTRNGRLGIWFKLTQILSFICLLLMCFYAYHLQLKTLIIICVFALLTFFYAIPFFKNGKNTLRNVVGLKVYVIAMVWAGTTVFIPVINEDYLINADVLLLGVQRFLYVLVLMIPFEIRDLKYDNSELKTVPQKTGVKGAKVIGIAILIVFFALEFFKNQLTNSNIVILFLITLFTSVFVICSKTEQGKYYSSFWVEALPIGWLLLLLVFN